MFSPIRQSARSALAVLFLLASLPVGAQEEPAPAEENSSSDTVSEIVIDDSGIIVREGEDQVEVEIGADEGEGKRLNVRVDNKRYSVDESYGEEEVTFGRDVTIHEDEIIHNPLVILFGDLDVHGEIVGDVVVVMGDVYVYEDAVITGDLLVVGGEVEREEGSLIVGEVTRSSGKIGDFMHWGDEWRFDDFEVHAGRPASAADAFFMLLEFLAVALAGAILLGARLPRFTSGLRLRPGRSFLVGLLTFVLAILLVVPVALLLIVLMLTLVGIPVAVLAIIALVGLGFIAWLIPLYTFSRYTFEARGMNRYLSVLIWAAIFWFFHAIVGGPGFLTGLVVFIEVLVFLFGLGALVTTRLGSRHLLVD